MLSNAADTLTRLLIFLFVVLVVPSCNSIDVYEKNVVIAGHQWSSSYKPQFTFTINDTTSSYQIYIVLRHTDAYRYNNIWLNLGTQFPGEAMRYQRLELQLGSDATGWEGTGMDDIWEVRKAITREPVKFKKPGNYVFSLNHIMREDPLAAVLNAGIRVQKIK